MKFVDDGIQSLHHWIGRPEIPIAYHLVIEHPLFVDERAVRVDIDTQSRTMGAKALQASAVPRNDGSAVIESKAGQLKWATIHLLKGS